MSVMCHTVGKQKHYRPMYLLCIYSCLLYSQGSGGYPGDAGNTGAKGTPGDKVLD